MADIGHNSNGQLQSFVSRLEKLLDEKAAIGEDIKEVFAEAKSAGFDVKALRALIKERAADAAKLAEHEAILETYRAALGGLADSPLGEAALRAAQ